jgi:hypothetical protein
LDDRNERGNMAEDRPTSRRKPVFFKIPMNWKQLTDEEKDAWSLQFLDAVIAAADPEDRPKWQEGPGSES